MPSSGTLPAVLPCAALLGGVLASAWLVLAPWVPLLSAALVVVAVGCRSSCLTRGALCLTLFCCGTLLDHADRQRAQERARVVLPDGAPYAAEVQGRIVGAPEFDEQGEARFRVRVEAPADASRGRPIRAVLSVHVSASSVVPGALDLAGLAAGDRVRMWCRVRRPRGYLNPGATQSEERLRIARIDGYASIKTAALIERLEVGRPSARRFADALRIQLRSRLDGALGTGGAVRAVAGALLIGDRSAVDPDTLITLRDAGLIHLIAISGLHVGWVTVLVIGGLRRGRAWPSVVLATGAGLIGLFALTVGARSSVLRASLAASAVLVSRVLGRDGDARNTLAVIAGVWVAVEPAVLREAAFQLSFVAVAALLRGSRVQQAGLDRSGAPSGWRMALSVYVATAPLVAWHLGRASPIGVVTNLIGVPLAGLLLMTGYLLLVLAEVPLAGEVSATCFERLAAALLGLATIGAAIEGGSFGVPEPGLWVLIAFYGLLAGPPGNMLGHFRSETLDRAQRAAIAALLVVVHLGPTPTVPEGLEASVIDVGQGQSVLVHAPEGRAVLVDTGGSYRSRSDIGARVVVPYLLRSGVRRLDVMILSHEHQDHVGGARAVLRDLEVGAVWIGPRALLHPRMAEIVQVARSRGSAVRVVSGGTATTVGSLPVRVLSPERAVGGSGNDDSVAVMLGVAPHRLLIPGDLEAQGERALVDGAASLYTEALVLAHHGSRSATQDAFLERANPRWVIASVGKRNRFGHPDPAVRARLRSRGLRLWRTDRHGRVRLRATRRGWEVSGMRVLAVHDERKGNERADEHQ